MICRTCQQTVDTYRPTGAPTRERAVQHRARFPSGALSRARCAGSFGPVDPEPVQRPRYPASDGGPSVTEYLRSKGEL